jgi:hypothetical protein
VKALGTAVRRGAAWRRRFTELDALVCLRQSDEAAVASAFAQKTRFGMRGNSLARQDAAFL